MKTLLIFFLAIVLISCESSSEDAQSGLYVYGHEVESLHLCGDTLSYWMLAQEGVRASLRARYSSLTERPYEPVFVTVRGAVSSRARDGFAMSYDGYFQIDTVLEVRAARATDCRMDEFRK